MTFSSALITGDSTKTGQAQCVRWSMFQRAQEGQAPIRVELNVHDACAFEDKDLIKGALQPEEEWFKNREKEDVVCYAFWQ